jgi:hypothetical protein
MSESLFPIDQVEGYIRSFKDDVQRESDVLYWSDHDGITSLKVDTLNEPTKDGLTISEQVTLEHISESLNKYEVSDLAYLNKFATIGALIAETAEQPARMVCKVGIFSQDRQAAERNYAPIIAGGCALLGWHVASIAKGQTQIDPNASPLSGIKDQTQLAVSDLESAAELLRKRDLFVNQDTDGLTVEFPWDEGAVSNVFLKPEMRTTAVNEYPGLSEQDLDRMAGQTSLLRIKKSSHPFFGNGVFASLELPISLEEEGLPQLINIFNRWEISNPDLSPLFGAWCLGPRAPSFVSFLPNQLCFPGVVQNLAMWDLARAIRVKGFIRSFSNH